MQSSVNQDAGRDLAVQEAGIEAEVAVFLHKHPDFFERHPELLIELRIPHYSGQAVSLIERQVDALREETARYRRQIAELVAMARTNDELNQRLHDLTLALIDAADFTEVLNTLEDHLHDTFKADAVELRLFSSTHLKERRETAYSSASCPDIEAFKEFYERNRPVCGRLTPKQLHILFGSQAEDMHSAALLPLQTDDILGVLAIGSIQADRFQPDMGTELLHRLTEIVSRKLQVVSLPGV